MISPDHVRLMAQYNRWQNRSLYGAANTLDEAARRADRGAFFRSIHTTLAHILWGDEAWMSRLAGRPFPDGKGLEADYLETRDWETLNRDRAAFDAWLIDWAADLTAATYTNWRPGQPNDSGDCAEMDPSETVMGTLGSWNDVPCDETKRFVCEAGP